MTELIGAQLRQIPVREAYDEGRTKASEVARLSLDLDDNDAAAIPSYLWPEDSGTTRVRLVALAGNEAVGIAMGSVQKLDAYLDLIAVIPCRVAKGAGRALNPMPFK